MLYTPFSLNSINLLYRISEKKPTIFSVYQEVSENNPGVALQIPYSHRSLDGQNQESLHEVPVPANDRDFLMSHKLYLQEEDVPYLPCVP